MSLAPTANVRVLEVSHSRDAMFTRGIPTDEMDRLEQQQAARALADAIVREASVVKSGPDRRGVITTRTSVAVVAKEDVDAMARALREAEARGMDRAAEMLREKAARYDRVDGPCKHVLRSSLYDAAQEVAAAARSSLTP